MASDRELELKQKSGNQSSSDPVAVLLYMLAKDYLKPSQLEEILAKLGNVLPGVVVFNNGWLGQYAKELASKLADLKSATLQSNQSAFVPSTIGVGGMTLQPSSSVSVTATKGPVSVEGSMLNLLPHLERTMSPEEVDQIRRDIQEFESAQQVDGLLDNLIVKGK